MEASFAELGYKVKDILHALKQNEKISVLYRGKVKAVLMPAISRRKKKVKEHPFFGMAENDSRPVSEIMNELRGNRFNAL